MKNKIDGLIQYKGTWNHGKTTVIRIPLSDKDNIMSYAKYIDKGGLEYDKILSCVDYLLSISDKLGIEKGYQSKNSGKMISELKEIINIINEKLSMKKTLVYKSLIRGNLLFINDVDYQWDNLLLKEYKLLCEKINCKLFLVNIANEYYQCLLVWDVDGMECLMQKPPFINSENCDSFRVMFTELKDLIIKNIFKDDSLIPFDLNDDEIIINIMYETPNHINFY